MSIPAPSDPHEASSLVAPLTKRKSQRIWRIFFAVCAGEGMLALLALMRIPPDPKNSLLWGYSLYRLLLLGALVGLETVIIVLLLIALLRSEFPRLNTWHPRLLWLQRFSLAGSLLTWAMLLFFELYGGRKFAALYERLAPLLVWLLLIFLQTIVLTLLLSNRLRLGALRSERAWWLPAGVALAACILLTVMMAVTGMGLVPDKIGWGSPGVPLREGQLWLLGALVLLGLIGVERRDSWLERRRDHLDSWLAGGIWLVTVAAWLSLPVQACYFALAPRAPNWEYYPFSDAGFYDYTAQSILDGDGFLGNTIVPRPLYILLLAVFHAIGGADYQQVVMLQTLLLAFLPVALYFLGKILHSRFAGLLLAILAILREVNQIAATPLATVASSKLLLSDLPTALGVSVFTALTASWLRAPQQKRWLPLIAGGMLGLTVLIRTQVMMLIPFVFLLVLIRTWSRRRLLLEGGLLFALGMVVCLLPWLWRNEQITGQPLLDQPGQVRLLAVRYDTSLSEFPMPEEGEDDAAFSQRMSAKVRQYLLTHPGEVAQFVTAHFLNNLVDIVLVLPWRQQADSLTGLFWILKDDWTGWQGKVSLPQGSMLVINLALISLGIGAAWRRMKWVGLLPLLVAIGYSFSNAIARNSGWRYILPADWVGYFYYGIGLIELLAISLWGLGILSRPAWLLDPPEASSDSPAAPLPIPQTAVCCLLFLLAGASLPAAERLVPKKWPQQTRQQLSAMIVDHAALLGSGLEGQELEQWLQQDKVEVRFARVVSPRYYHAGEGEPGNDWQAYIPRQFDRLGFMLLAHGRKRDVLLRTPQPPDHFPNAAMALVAGCATRRYLDAALVIILEPPATLYLSNSQLPNCK